MRTWGSKRADYGDHQFFNTAASETENAEVARLLIRAGVDPTDFENEVLREVTGAALMPARPVSQAEFEAQKTPRFGRANPEAVDHAFWLEMIRTGQSGYGGHEAYGPGPRSIEGPPVWSFDRFGMTTTVLPGGRWVQIAGEHEDAYDPDFHIYNDVVVHDGKGGTQIYLYPEEIFPPTDFHTATLVGDAIYLIGSLSYEEKRKPGETQVLRLDLNNFSISRVPTSGETPGWISRHKAKLKGEKITVWDGEIWTGEDYVAFGKQYALDLETMAWSKTEGA